MTPAHRARAYWLAQWSRLTRGHRRRAHVARELVRATAKVLRHELRRRR